MKIRSFGGSAMLATAVVFSPTGAAGAPCESLAALTLPDTTITSAQTVAAGAFTPPGGLGFPEAAVARFRASVADLPAFCRVAATLRPSTDSDIKIEVWMPLGGWNGKYQAVGNGGWAGRISYGGMAEALRRGYATSSTDTGHTRGGGGASFALGHPEKLVDFGYRAMHEMTVRSKRIIRAFYDQGPRLSYFSGCSTGGRQALMEAQRYPADFDGIIAGAPANKHIYMHAGRMQKAIEILRDQARLLPLAKITLLHQAVLAACDAGDGLKDGLVNDPRQCRFDPSTLLCTDSDADDCLTAPQVESVNRVYAPTITKTGEQIFPGFSPGFERGWRMPRAGGEPASLALDTFRYVAHEDPDWDWQTFDLDRDLALAIRNAGFINAINPDLSAFKARGGKLLMYHGWNDSGIAPENTVDYYSSVLQAMGPDQADWMRLFMIPGMGHCGGGPGPGQANFLGALERWRESGVAPEQITASRVTNNRVDMTRPLCPFPQVAQYQGTGSTDDAANFVCVLPERVQQPPLAH